MQYSVLYEGSEHALRTVVVHHVGGGTARPAAAAAATTAATFQFLGPLTAYGAAAASLLRRFFVRRTVIGRRLRQRPI